MLNRTCAACGGVLQKGEGNTAVCMRCFRTYRLESSQLAPPRRKQELDKETRIGLIFMMAIMAMVFMALGVIPAVVILVVGIVKQGVQVAQKSSDAAESAVSEQHRETKRNIPFGTYLKTRSDYLRALRGMPLGTMPLGVYGERAAEQIERLAMKQRGLRDMLGSDHPFVRSAEEAENFIFDNCRKIIWRLKYCDQTDPGFCRIHAEYMQSALEANEKVLNDYERLMIEVSQMDEPLQTAPSLDVLAETLRSVRTGEQPEEAIYQQYERQYEKQSSRRMMMR